MAYTADHMAHLELPKRTPEEYMANTFFYADEVAAQELYGALSGIQMRIIEKNADVPLPKNGVFGGDIIHSHVHVALPAPCNTLTRFMTDQLDRIGEKDYLYSQFGFTASFENGSQLLRITRNEQDIPFSMGRTILAYTMPPYLKSAWAATALVPDELVREIQEHGIFVSAHRSYTEASLAIPGRIIKRHNLKTFRYETEWFDDVLYPVDLNPKPHGDLIHQGFSDEATLRRLITQDISPVHVQVFPTETVDYFIKKQ